MLLEPKADFDFFKNAKKIIKMPFFGPDTNADFDCRKKLVFFFLNS